MYACFVDESGHCGEKYDPNQPVEVLCGVITDVTKMFKTQREHSKILKVLEKNNIRINEIKAKEIYRRAKAWHLVSFEDRYSIIDQLLKWADERGCKFVVCPIDSKKHFDLVQSGCVIANKFRFPYIAGAMNIILALQRYKTGSPSNKGKTWVIFDEQNSHDGSIINFFDSDLAFTDGYTGYDIGKKRTNIPERLNEIIEIPFFTKSHLSTVIQIADLVAFIVNWYIQLTVFGRPEKYEGELKQIEKWYKIIQGNLIPHSNLNPSVKGDNLCDYFKEIRPDGWHPKTWIVAEKAI